MTVSTDPSKTNTGGNNPNVLREIPDPAALLDTGQIYSNDIDGRTELMYKDDQDAETQITSLGGLNVPAGVTDFLGLSDTPGAFVANRIVHVNAAADALLVSSEVNVINGALVIGKGTTGGGGIKLDIQRDFATKETLAIIANRTNGTQSGAVWRAESTLATSFIQIEATAPGFTPVSGRLADEGMLSVGSTLSSMALITEGNAPIRFVPNKIEAARFLSTREFLVGLTSLPTSRLVAFERNQNASVIFHLNNATSGTSASTTVGARTGAAFGVGGGVGLDIQALAPGFSGSGSAEAGAGRLVLQNSGATTLNIVTLTQLPVKVFTDDAERARFLGNANTLQFNAGGTVEGGALTGNDLTLSSNALFDGKVIILGLGVLGIGEGGIVAAAGNTFRAPDIVTGGAGNVVGADLTIAAGLGTGTGDVGTVVFSLPIVVGAGDFIQTTATRLTLGMVGSTSVLTMNAAQAMTISTAVGNLALLPAGNVGIGTTDPDTLLEISGAGNQFLRVTSTDDSQTGIEFFRPDNADTDWRILNDGGSLFIKSSGDDFTNTSPKMAIRVGGNALVDSTTVDISKLQIRVIRASNTVVQGMGIGFVHDTSNGNVGAAIVHERVGLTSKGKLHFATKGSEVASADIPIRMTIDENGDVSAVKTVTASNLKTHALVENRNPATSTASATFVTLESSSAVVFSGRPVLCFVNVTMFPSVADLKVELAVQIDAGADAVAAQLNHNETEHNTVQGAVIVTPSAGSHTLRVRWRVAAGTGTLTLDANDQILLHAVEL